MQDASHSLLVHGRHGAEFAARRSRTNATGGLALPRRRLSIPTR
jgi:hypothetical protein